MTRRLSPRSPLFLSQVLQKLRWGLDSDGLVPTDHQRVPGTHVVERRLDHAQAAIGALAGTLTEELLTIARGLPEVSD